MGINTPGETLDWLAQLFYAGSSRAPSPRRSRSSGGAGSGSRSRRRRRGKPAPDVYLTAARRLGVPAASCLTLEDSPNGLASAKAAGMRCVAVPDPELAGDPRYREADLVLGSLTQLDDAARRRLGVPVPG